MQHQPPYFLVGGVRSVERGTSCIPCLALVSWHCTVQTTPNVIVIEPILGYVHVFLSCATTIPYTFNRLDHNHEGDDDLQVTRLNLLSFTCAFPLKTAKNVARRSRNGQAFAAGLCFPPRA